jgi:hypothetical protein
MRDAVLCRTVRPAVPAASHNFDVNCCWCSSAALLPRAIVVLVFAGVPLVQKLYRMLMSTGIITVLVCDFHYFFAKKPEA